MRQDFLDIQKKETQNPNPDSDPAFKNAQIFKSDFYFVSKYMVLKPFYEHLKDSVLESKPYISIHDDI